MKFEYNADLTYEERVIQTSKEILDTYPGISKTEAIFAAGHTSSVDDRVTNDNRFERYYYILRTIGKNNAEFKKVLNDAYIVYNMGLSDRKYIDIMPKIFDYFISNNVDFPEFV